MWPLLSDDLLDCIATLGSIQMLACMLMLEKRCRRMPRPKERLRACRRLTEPPFHLRAVDVMGYATQSTHLHLCDNQIGDAGCSSLADACAKGALAQLHILHLEINQIGDAGCSSLADACTKGAMAQLTHLYIDLQPDQ